MIVYPKDSKALLNMVLSKSTKVKSFNLTQGDTKYKFNWNEVKWCFYIISSNGFKTTMSLEAFRALISNRNFRYIDINIKTVVNK